MTTAAVSEVKARLSEFLGRVKAGQEVVITERGKPVARLCPLAFPGGRRRVGWRDWRGLAW
jgi:prevent-host-death family protein